MPIKYGDLTIIFNKEEMNVFSNLLMWLTYDETPPISSKYVFLFDDGEICDSNDKYKDFNFKFCNTCETIMPLYFEKKQELHKRIYFYKKPTKKNNRDWLDFSKLFSSYSNFDLNKTIESYYNSIYYCYKDCLLKPEIFGIIRIKSNEYMPRFQFAYDSDEFTKEEIVYLIHYIFNQSNLQK